MEWGRMGMVEHCVVFLCAILSFLLLRNHKRKSQRQQHALPPGSMGWPYVGESLQLYSQDPNVFFISKQKKYGEIFKSHLLGCPSVMLASPDAAKFVLVTQAHLFKPTYPRSKERLVGPWALFFHEGEYHMRIRKMVQGSLTPEALRGLVPDIERLVISMLESWAGSEVPAFHALKKFTFDVSVLIIFGDRLDERYKQKLRKNYFLLDKGYNSFPSIIPGTLYQKAMQARKRLRSLVNEIMSKPGQREAQKKGLLDSLMDLKDDKGEPLSDDQIADNIIGVMFAAQDTTASVMTWLVKFLHDNPKLRESIKAEQMVIWESNDFGSRPLTWAQTRTMTLTNKFILESLRMASVISFAFREAVADVEYRGYLIPKGWKVMPLFRNIHHNADFFPEPGELNPCRFKVAPSPNTFLPFGTGVHACPGSEVAKLEMFLVIHHLVTQYRLEIVGSRDCETEYCPFPVPKHGLPTKLWRLCSSRKLETMQQQKAGD